MSFKELFEHKLEDDGLFPHYRCVNDLYDMVVILLGHQSDSYFIWDEIGEYVRRYAKR